jgi:hypothetical protein
MLCLEYPHTFTSQLKGQTVVEHDRAEFEIDVEAEDAEVVWYRDGKRIIPEQVKVFSKSLWSNTWRPRMLRWSGTETESGLFRNR